MRMRGSRNKRTETSLHVIGLRCRMISPGRQGSVPRKPRIRARLVEVLDLQLQGYKTHLGNHVARAGWPYGGLHSAPGKAWEAASHTLTLQASLGALGGASVPLPYYKPLLLILSSPPSEMESRGSSSAAEAVPLLWIGRRRTGPWSTLRRYRCPRSRAVLSSSSTTLLTRL